MSWSFSDLKTPQFSVLRSLPFDCRVSSSFGALRRVALAVRVTYVLFCLRASNTHSLPAPSQTALTVSLAACKAREADRNIS